MAQLMEYAEYLSKEIGPRPAGTEEEQQAALYITECFQKDSGFSAQIEEFTSSSNVDFLSAVPGLIVIIVAILGMIFPMLAIPAFILAAAAAALYTLEALGHPIVTRALARGASQNVVVKYQPNYDADKGPRGRKIVLVAHYDSGKVTPGLVRMVESLKLPIPVGLVFIGGIVLAAFFLLLHIFINAGVGAIVVNVLTVITLLICAYPVVRVVLYRVAPYNEGANNNATGTAAIIEVARRISRGSVSEADLAESEAAQGVSIHGEAAARESGYIPEGAQIQYEAERLVPPSELGEYDDEERLLAAKAAIAALTGQPVERRTYGSVASQLVNSRAQDEEPAFEAPAAEGETPVAPAVAVIASEPAAPFAEEALQQPLVQPVEQPVLQKADARSDAEGYTNAPSWFVAAQQNAKRPATENAPVQRSRYAEAIEAAEREAAEREREREEALRLQREAELKAREQAAREAIEQQAQAAAKELEPAPEPAPAPEPEPIAVPASAPEPPAQETAPVFVPYDQAEKMAAKPVDDRPTDDEFAASLGSTMAFVPLNLQQESAEETNELPEGAARNDSRLSSLPAIEEPAPEPVAVPETTSPSRSGLFRKLRTNVPSMSGVIRMQEAGEDVSQPPVQYIPPVPQQQPVPEAAAPAPGSLAQDDKVDYDLSPAELGAYAGDIQEPMDDREELAQVEMPKSRAGGFINRFRKNDREPLEETPQEWLDVDENFDARTVGRERGGWESFRDDAPSEAPTEESNRRWEGGAFSRVRLGRVDTRSNEEEEVEIADDSANIEFAEDDRQIADEIEQIYHFRNPLYNTEIWFVALGSETMSHDGTKAFLQEHSDELRGSMIIEVESLGLGELAVASAEGRVKKTVASSRIKRYTHTATAATGIAPGSVNLTGSDSAASIMQAAGYQAMHLLGVENGAPALKGSPDDILENVDDLLLDDNVNFLMELLKK